MHIKYGMTP